MDNKPNNTFDTSFLRNGSDDELKKTKFDNNMTLVHEMLGGLEDMMGKMDNNLEVSMNKKIATGNCYVRNNILFQRVKGEDDQPIWFPKGNALEYQAQNSKENADKAIKLQGLTGKLEQLMSKDIQPFITVAINKAIGGFGLSRAGIILGRQLSGNAQWGGCVLAEDMLGDKPLGDDYFGSIEIERHDPILLTVIDTLKEKANTSSSDLHKITIFDNAYIVNDDGTGCETVIARKDFKFTEVSQ
jgi:hypothetical protein